MSKYFKWNTESGIWKLIQIGALPFNNLLIREHRGQEES